jgi:crotonobetainyl-CoA:carnitine CoA-transferase CaiB-like acyl-CoA transferase
MTVVSNGIKVGDEGFEVSRRAPNVGEHTIEILTSFGYSPDAVADLTSRGVITQQ